MVYGFNSITINIPSSSFVDVNKLLLKSGQKGIKRSNLPNKTPRRIITRMEDKLLNFKTYYKSKVIIESGIVETINTNRIDSLEMDIQTSSNERPFLQQNKK